MRRLPLFWLSIALLLGVMVSAYLNFLDRFWVYLMAASCIGLVIEGILRKRIKNRSKIYFLPVPFFLLLLLFFMGGWRFQAVLPHFLPNDLAFYNDRGLATIEGIVVSDPQVLEHSVRLIVQAESVRIGEGKTIPVDGKVITQVRMGDFSYGDRLLLKGGLTTPPENDSFSYKDYLARSQVYSLLSFPQVRLLSSQQGNPLKQGLYSARQFIHHKIQDFLPQPEAALLSGILLGIETDIPQTLEEAFQNTGTAHIIAISGFNMAILAALFLKGFRRWLPVWWAGILAVLAIFVYTFFVGAAPAVQRAAVMSSLSMTGSLIGRKQAGPFTLLITAVVMVFFNPLVLWDAGFQLSVMATLGLILYADKILDWFQRWMRRWVSQDRVKQVSGPVGEYFLFTLAAQLTIFPVLLYHFESFSLSSFIANPLILPPQPLIMIFGGIAVLIGLVIPFLGKLLSTLIWLPLVYTNRMVTWLAELPAGVIQFGEINWVVVLALYILIFGLTLKSKFRDWLFSVWKPAFGTVFCVGCALLVWNVGLNLPDGSLKVDIFGLPYRQGILVQTPYGHTILINPGEHANHTSAVLTQHKSVFDRSVDAILITTDKQHDYAALPLLFKRFQIDRILWITDPPKTNLVKQIYNTVHHKQIQLTNFSEGMVMDCGDGVSVEVLLSEKNKNVILIMYQNFRMLVVAGEVAHEFLDQLEAVDVVYLIQDDQLLDWQQIQPTLIILPEVKQELVSRNSIKGLNEFNGMEIVTDGESYSLFVK